VFRSDDRFGPFAALPGVQRDAPKRNVIVALVYLLLSLLAVGAVRELLSVLPPVALAVAGAADG
jgi:hypothetical protein